MSIQQVSPNIAPLIPDNAPFSPDQRSWLNGFFAGLLTLQGEAQGLQPVDAATALGQQVSDDPLADGDDGEAPWHDMAMPMDERMELAQDRPLRRRMMAAMAQQDCGQCGYECEVYADKLFLGEEERMNLCAPGGKATTRMLKKLALEMTEEKAAPNTASTSAPTEPLGYSREHPVEIAFLGSEVLNKEGSQKETVHIDFDLRGAGIDYAAGDSMGIFAENAPTLVESLLQRLALDPAQEIAGKSLKDVLCADKCLGEAPDELYEALATLASDPEDGKKLSAMAEGEDPDGDLETLDVLGVFEKFPTLMMSAEQLLTSLEGLQPRLYSISSSPKTKKDHLSLTVDVVRYTVEERARHGVASTYFADHLTPGSQIKAYIQKAHDFSLPADEKTPVIMCGPGTGIAPFRSFMQDRVADKCSGASWLFYGHQREACDFFYKEEWEAYQQQQQLTRLSTAWSRDEGQPKTYVQDVMRTQGADIFEWFEKGAHFYICGDASRMATDVDKALQDIIAEHGKVSDQEAKAYLAEMVKAGRYQKDVY